MPLCVKAASGVSEGARLVAAYEGHVLVVDHPLPTVEATDQVLGKVGDRELLCLSR